MEDFDTLVEALEALKKQGYTEDFNLRQNCLECGGKPIRLFPSEFHIDRYYRFEGMTNPSDEVILYAISSPRYHVKGTLVNAYGIYSESATDEMLSKLSIS